MKQRITRRRPRPRFHIAIVVKEATDLATGSARPDHDWASFIDQSQSAAIARAQAALDRWTRQGYGPYIILVGTVTGRVVRPVQYTVVNL